MFFIIPNASISKALSIISCAVPSVALGATNDLIKLEATDDHKLIFTACKPDMEVVFTSEANVVRPGKISIPYGRLNDLIKLSDFGETCFNQEENHQLTITQSRKKYKLPWLSHSDMGYFFVKPDKDSEHVKSLTIPALSFIEALDSVAFCCVSDVVATELSGVHFQPTKNEPLMTLRATDSIKVAIKSFSLQDNGTLDDLILDGSYVKHLKRIIKKLPNPESMLLTVKTDVKLVQIDIDGDTVITCVRTSGHYPKLEQLIPATFHTSLKIERKDLIKAIARLASLDIRAASKTIGSRIDFVLNCDTLTLMFEVDEVAGVEYFDVKFSGDPKKFSASSRYLLDILGHIEEPMVVISINNGKTLFRLSGDRPNCPNYYIMPIHLT